MTEKQEKILEAALHLFAKEGFKSTSTSKVAKQAGVSEGLIFRHFINKDGLLDAIIKLGEERFKMLFADIVLETDPKKVIEKTLNICNTMIDIPEEASFWKLQYKIKWELENYSEHKIEPLQNTLTIAFTKLGYASPTQEALQLLLILDGLATRLFLQDRFDAIGMVAFLKSKYEL